MAWVGCGERAAVRISSPAAAYSGTGTASLLFYQLVLKNSKIILRFHL